MTAGIHIDVTQKENIRLCFSISEPLDGHEKFMTIFNKNSRTVQKHNTLLWESNQSPI